MGLQPHGGEFILHRHNFDAEVAVVRHCVAKVARHFRVAVRLCPHNGLFSSQMFDAYSWRR